MPIKGKTQILSVHHFRRSAEVEERRLQRTLDEGYLPLVEGNQIPRWVKGARVRKAGLFQWVVEANEWRGN
jgi:hypothetical protein